MTIESPRDTQRLFWAFIFGGVATFTLACAFWVMGLNTTRPVRDVAPMFNVYPQPLSFMYASGLIGVTFVLVCAAFTLRWYLKQQGPSTFGLVAILAATLLGCFALAFIASFLSASSDMIAWPAYIWDLPVGTV